MFSSAFCNINKLAVEINLQQLFMISGDQAR
jgi:hypothetical protein